METWQTTSVRIERVGQKGQGVGADAQGNIYFVVGAVPGDTVTVRFASGGKRYRDAELVAVETPSPQRRVPPCPYATECGGCDWQHWTYEAQLEGKAQIVRHVLARAGLEAAKIAPVAGATEELGYRNRIQVRREAGRTGFYRKRSHDIVDIEECRVAKPEINQALAEVRRESFSSNRTKIELYLTDSGKVARLDNRAHSAEGFAQINTEQNGKLREFVADFVRRGRSRRVLELFCGNGNLTFPLAPFVEAIHGADASDSNIARAEAKARELGLRHVTFQRAWVEASLRRRLPADVRDRYDTLVLDPPRTGAGALDPFLHPGLTHIVYVSCSPASFSQDVQVLKSSFDLVEVQPLDMFPQTRHIELVSWWRRARR